MAKQITDDEQNLRRKARRRLIGAVALTLVVVVVLPMVLDSQPAPSGRDIELNIPNQDKAGAFMSGVAVREGVKGNAAAASAVVVSPLPVEKIALANDIKSGAQTNTAKQVVDSGNESAAAAKAVTVATGKVQPATSKPVNVGADSYVVQIGAYSSTDKAKQELSKLKKWGFRAYIEKAGDKTRVRVGPYTEREKAEKALHQLEKHGLHPAVMSAK
jgi:DedD protein